MKQWKDMHVFPCRYEVSSDGEIRNKKSGRFLKPATQSSGYMVVNLCKDNHSKTVFLSTAILTAFVSPRPRGYCSRHIDGNLKNNAIANLEWVERTTPIGRGECHPASKLTESDVEVIRSVMHEVSNSELAKAHGVEPNTIRAIRDGKTWTHTTP